MNPQEILALNTTKTEKIKLLLELGLSRKQVTEIDQLQVRYGFVQNVFAKYFPDQVQSRSRSARRQEARNIRRFIRKFGVEIEAYGVDKRALQLALDREGVEIKIENYNHTTRNHWKIVYDSSLEGDLSFELVSPPLKGEKGLKEVEKVCEILEDLNAKINKTCGLHIHFEAKNFTMQTWRNLALNYKKLESEIDSFMPRSRRTGNRYCQSLRQISDRKIKQAQTVNDLQRAFTTRYRKVNINSYARHKTIEFRQHSGTVEYAKISNWILFLDGLVHYSENHQIARADFNEIEKFTTPATFSYLTNRKAHFTN